MARSSAIVLEDSTGMWKVEKESASLIEDETKVSTESALASADTVEPIWSQLHKQKQKKGMQFR